MVFLGYVTWHPGGVLARIWKRLLSRSLTLFGPIRIAEFQSPLLLCISSSSLGPPQGRFCRNLNSWAWGLLDQSQKWTSGSPQFVGLCCREASRSLGFLRFPWSDPWLSKNWFARSWAAGKGDVGLSTLGSLGSRIERWTCRASALIPWEAKKGSKSCRCWA